METDCNCYKTIWIFSPEGPLKIYAMEDIKRVCLMKEWVIPANDAMVCNEFNTWQIMKMALEMSSFLASPCLVQLNKICIKNKSNVFCLVCTRVLNLNYGSIQCPYSKRVISLTCSSLLTPPRDEFYGFQGRFDFQSYLCTQAVLPSVSSFAVWLYHPNINLFSP